MCLSFIHTEKLSKSLVKSMASGAKPPDKPQLCLYKLGQGVDEIGQVSLLVTQFPCLQKYLPRKVVANIECANLTCLAHGEHL